MVHLTPPSRNRRGADVLNRLQISRNQHQRCLAALAQPCISRLDPGYHMLGHQEKGGAAPPPLTGQLSPPRPLLAPHFWCLCCNWTAPRAGWGVGRCVCWGGGGVEVLVSCWSHYPSVSTHMKYNYCLSSQIHNGFCCCSHILNSRKDTRLAGIKQSMLAVYYLGSGLVARCRYNFQKCDPRWPT